MIFQFSPTSVRTLLNALPVGLTILSFAIFRSAQNKEQSHKADDSQARIVIESSPDGLACFDQALACTFASMRAAALFDRAPADLLGRPFADLVGEDAAAALRAVDHAQIGTSVAEAVIRQQRANGECRWIEIRCAPLTDRGDLVASCRDVTLRETADIALRAANSELNRLAGSDALTDLANHRRFEQTLEVECRRAARNESPLSLLLLEIDDFAAFTDRHGVAAGDDCLKRVAEALRSETARTADRAARLGGEEFALLLPQAGEAEAAEATEKLHAAILGLAIPHGGRDGVASIVTASIGSATLRPTPDTLPTAAATLLADADRWLRAARTAARGADENGRPDELMDLVFFPARSAPEVDQVARIAAVLLGLPSAFVVTKETHGWVIVGHYGLEGRAIAAEWGRMDLRDGSTLVVPDTEAEPDFRRAKAEAGFAFLAAAPLRVSRERPPIGALWVADHQSRDSWGESESLLLGQLAGLAAESLAPGGPPGQRTFRAA